MINQQKLESLLSEQSNLEKEIQRYTLEYHKVCFEKQQKYKDAGIQAVLGGIHILGSIFTSNPNSLINGGIRILDAFGKNQSAKSNITEDYILRLANYIQSLQQRLEQVKQEIKEFEAFDIVIDDYNKSCLFSDNRYDPNEDLGDDPYAENDEYDRYYDDYYGDDSNDSAYLEELETFFEYTINQLFDQGSKCLESQDYEVAISIFDQLLRRDSNQYWAWYLRGNALLNLQQYEEALHSYDIAISINCNQYSFWYNKGYVLLQLGKKEEALLSFQKATGLDSQQYLAWYLCGNLLFNSGKYHEALVSYERAIQIEPRQYFLWYERGLSLANIEQYQEAILSFNQALEIDPSQYLVWYYRGLTFFNLGNQIQAINSFDKCLSIKNDFALALQSKSKALECLESYESITENPLWFQTQSRIETTPEENRNSEETSVHEYQLQDDDSELFEDENDYFNELEDDDSNEIEISTLFYNIFDPETEELINDILTRQEPIESYGISSDYKSWFYRSQLYFDGYFDTDIIDYINYLEYQDMRSYSDGLEY